MSLGSTAAARHALALIDPTAWTAVLADRPDLAAEPLLTDWAAQGWPLVVRRRCGDDRPGHLALGLPLPPSHGKRRIAVDVSPAAVMSVRPPVPLAEIHAVAPTEWHQIIDDLLYVARDIDVEVRVFGSFAWSSLTGLDYVRTGSDLDLIWPLTERTDDLFQHLAVLEEAAPGRLDGEVVNDLGAAANWRELAGNPTEILVKTVEDVTLVKTTSFLRSMPSLA